MNMNSMLNLILEISKNSQFKKILSVLFILIPLCFLYIKNSEFFFLTFIMIIGVIYFYVQLFKLIFELTSAEPFKKDVKAMHLFWILLEFQIVFSIIIAPLIFFILNYLNSLPGIIYTVLNLFLISLHSILLILIIGSRSSENILHKLGLILKDKYLLKLIFSLMAVIASFQFSVRLNNCLKIIFIFLMLIAYLLMFISIIREWQKVFFKNEIAFSAE